MSRMPLVLVIVTAAWASAAAGPAAPARPDVYTVSAPDGPAALDVELCFGSDPPGSLQGPGRHLDRLRTTRGSARVRAAGGGRLVVSGARPGDCVAWTAHIGAASAERAARFGLERETPVLPSSDWLPRASRASQPPPLLRLDLADGMAASVPWKPMDEGRPGRDYVLGDAPASWPDLTAFGAFETKEIRVPGARLDVAVLPGSPAPDRARLLRWIEANALAITAVHGRFPVPRAQVLVVPVDRGGEAVPWAQVNRGGGPGVHFFVNPSYPPESFLADWTAAHEMAHLLLPFVRRTDAWLSEGFASYYQNVSRPRVGLLDAGTAWEKLHAGFRRGEASPPMTLREASRAMRRQGTYMRVYWSGAAIALIADVGLRERSGGRLSLDTVLGRLAACCLPSQRRWTAVELLERLDALGGDGIFMAEYERWIDSRDFPDYRAAFAALGLDTSGDTLRQAPDPATRALRDAIMGPVSPSSPGQPAAAAGP